MTDLSELPSRRLAVTEPKIAPSNSLTFYEKISSDSGACCRCHNASRAPVQSWNFGRNSASDPCTDILWSRLLPSWVLLRTVWIRLLCSAVLEAPILGTGALAVLLRLGWSQDCWGSPSRDLRGLI